ncbi:MAG: YdcF family protein [Deltaproteobacteria bacterium]|nr:YdcF family protein [Deltaproteobacteria bacterium]
MEYFLFVTKKLVSVIIYPVGLTLTLILVALIISVKNCKRSGMVLFILAGLTLFAFSLGWTGNALLKPLEDQAGPYANPGKLQAIGVRYIVVLGGTSFTNQRSASDIWDRSVLRLLESVQLWKEMPGAKLVLSGGAPSSAEAMAALPAWLGVPTESLILETRALDTDDEARLFMPIVGNEPFALVTSASHMPRSLRIFRSKGMNPLPCPCDFRAQTRQPFFVAISPSADGLYNSQLALHEYYGQLALYIKGLGRHLGIFKFKNHSSNLYEPFPSLSKSTFARKYLTLKPAFFRIA